MGDLMRDTVNKQCVGGYQFTKTGLVPPTVPTYDGWREAGEWIAHCNDAILWWVGDWLLAGESNFPEQYRETLQHFGYTQETCRNAQSVSHAIPFSRRRENVKWSFHADVAGMDVAEQERLLSDAENEGWTRKRLREEKATLKRLKGNSAELLPECCKVMHLQQLIEDGKKFGTIYADPPWQYGNQATRAATDNHYQTMTIDEIAALPVRELAADYCHLHLWTTNAFLFECPKLFEVWGFVYQGMLVWCKPQMGIGNCYRVSHEILLIAIRGEPRTFRDHAIPSWLELDRGRHSAKPEEFRQIIQRVSPGPYLELFARREALGWVVWGNEIEEDLFSQSAASAVDSFTSEEEENHEPLLFGEAV